MSNERSTSEPCPTNDFEQGTPSGKCWGDGHCLCKDCVNYRADFAKHGQSLIDFAHDMQAGIIIEPLTARV